MLRIVRAPGEEYFTQELKIDPSGIAVWELVAEVTGTYKGGCSMPEHVTAGMEGTIEVSPDIPAG